MTKEEALSVATVLLTMTDIPEVTIDGNTYAVNEALVTLGAMKNKLHTAKLNKPLSPKQTENEQIENEICSILSRLPALDTTAILSAITTPTQEKLTRQRVNMILSGMRKSGTICRFYVEKTAMFALCSSGSVSDSETVSSTDNDSNSAESAE